MIYQEVEAEMGDHWYSFCPKNLGKKYSQWLVPCRILDITPAEFIKLLTEDYNAIVKYYPSNSFLSYKWSSRVDESRWRLFINKAAQVKGFHI